MFWVKFYKDDLSFQKFRESNPFGPQADTGRLTVLNSGSIRQQPPSQPRVSLIPEQVSRNPPPRNSFVPQSFPETFSNPAGSQGYLKL